ncbi:MAG: hypothetical protein RL196_392 [Actinomycetota bacterium]|jgi:hypothetical protein
MTLENKSVSLSVLFDPSLPLTKNFTGSLAIATGNGQNVKSLVIAQKNQAKAAINGLHFGKLNAAKSDWVLKADAFRIDDQSWAPEQKPGNKAQQNQDGDNAQAQRGYDGIDNNRGKGENPHDKGSELIRSRPEFFRRHWVILTDKVQVCA